MEPDLFRGLPNGLEGLVSKRRDHPCHAGRSKHWIKVKNPQHPAMNSCGAVCKIAAAVARSHPAGNKNGAVTDAVLGAPWIAPTLTGADGSDPLWLCWRGKPAHDPCINVCGAGVKSIESWASSSYRLRERHRRSRSWRARKTTRDAGRMFRRCGRAFIKKAPDCAGALALEGYIRLRKKYQYLLPLFGAAMVSAPESALS